MTIGELVQLTKEKAAEILSAAMRYTYENENLDLLNAEFPFYGFEVTPPRGIYREAEFEPSDGQTGALNTNTKGSYIIPEKKASKWSVLLLTEKEIQRMPKKFRPDFRVGRIVAHVRQKENGVYEIRCQINKKQIAASSKNLETAKMKFIEALKNRENAEQTTVPVPVPEPVPDPGHVTLGEYMLKWLETVKKPTVKEITYKSYFLTFKNHINPAIGENPLNEIKSFDLQNFINDLALSQNKKNTAKCCVKLLKMIFEYAVYDNILIKSPMVNVSAPHYEYKEGIPLNRNEEKKLVEIMLKTQNIYAQAYVFMLYTGLRRSELASVEIIDGWVRVISAKGRKDRKAKPRAVPISPMLAELLPFIDIAGIIKLNIFTLTDYAYKFIPTHHVHELRHTFITRCQECGIRREIVSLWAGHAADSSITTTVYTHLEHNKNIQLDEIKKFKYKLELN